MLNCTAAFGSSVRDRNYSGWSDYVLNGEEKFINGYGTVSEKKDKRSMQHNHDIERARKSFEAVQNVISR